MEVYTRSIVVLLSIIQDVMCQLNMFSPNNEGIAVPLRKLDITNVTTLTFRVKACADAHLIIQRNSLPDLNTPGNYAFAIGSWGNTRVELGKDLHTQPRITKLDTVALSCLEYRPFWASWADGFLRFGRGNTIGSDELVNNNTGPLIGYRYAFILTGWGSHGCWQFDVGQTIINHRMIKIGDNQKLSGTKIKMSTSKSKSDCMMTCVAAVGLSCECVQFSFDSDTKTCIVISRTQTATLTDHIGWTSWTLL